MAAPVDYNDHLEEHPWTPCDRVSCPGQAVLDRRKCTTTIAYNDMPRAEQCECGEPKGLVAHRIHHDNVAVFCCCNKAHNICDGDSRVDHQSRTEKRFVCSSGTPEHREEYSPLPPPGGDGPIQRVFHSLHLAEKDVQKKMHSPLRSSLFHGVPPTIYFYTDAHQVLAMPPVIRKQLRWKLSTITPLLIRQTVSRSGFRLTKRLYWNGMWDKHIKCATFASIKNYQKVNHFPGSFNLGRKDRLWQNICRMQRLHGGDSFQFLPDTFLLPHDLRSLKVAWLQEGDDHCWIVKPPASARGSGVHVVHQWAQISKKQPLIVQRYIRNPYLINGTKFDLRLYALVTSFHPLKIYVFQDGLVRFASVEYSYDSEDLSDRFMHLTNYSINKKSATYSNNTDSNQCQGHKWSIKALRGYLENLGVDFNKLWDQMVQIIIKTFICCETPINRVIEKHTSSKYTCYELFGFDILLDEDLIPWLLEVNISPSLRSSTPVDWDVKGQVVKDLLNIVGYQIPQKPQDTSVLHMLGLGSGEADFPHLSQVLHTVELSEKEAEKHHHFESNPEDGAILESLTPDDVRALIQSEDELSRRGSFERVFPTAHSRPLLELMVRPRYYNLLLAAWEERHGIQRHKGVGLLQSLCRRNLHLRPPPGMLSQDSSTTQSEKCQKRIATFNINIKNRTRHT
ncbi:tubulin monoglutamylase TTLL4-like isoform X2 [Ornithodoros turicata]|uniref:tubulin monoglutamylase TTLL4-like isoform X2 n=1 Tax=Ornithodoros turicata TaxID=34597 RepID=UPI0031391470